MNHTGHLETFARLESNVRSYCRKFDDLFTHASGAWLTTASGRRILDFLSGAGSLNYGHNNPAILKPVVEYLIDGGIVQSLDLHTGAKLRFLETFSHFVLTPRGLDYKMQFPGPTGTNAVEAALKVARKFTGRRLVAAFSRGYHGMTLGALAATSNPLARGGAGVPLDHVIFWPYEGAVGEGVDTIALIEQDLDYREETDKPAAAIIELVQGEGGLNHASAAWLRRVSAVARRHGVLLIVDDIQAGCGRTGDFFSFEPAGVVPDIVLLSKSLSGFGSPLSLVLLRPALDLWQPGEHNGTFRGNNLAFVGATAAIETYWSTPRFGEATRDRARYLHERLTEIATTTPGLRPRGRGLMAGLEFDDPALACACSQALYARSIMAETCGDRDQTLKLLPPLTIELKDLEQACADIRAAVGEVTAGADGRPPVRVARQRKAI